MGGRRLAPLCVALVLAAVYGLAWPHAQGLPASAPGGFLETATSTTVRPGYTAQQLQAWLPDRGTFTFPAPYNTTGIRLTNASDCGGADCVDYVGYSYWRNMNNSAGSDFLYAFVGLNSNRGGVGPSLFRYDKTTGATVNLGPLFAAGDPMSSATGEGWYFSATQPTTLYLPSRQELRRYDVLTHVSSVVFNIADELGGDKYLSQVHSSNDDRVHSFTLGLASNHAQLGCATYREDTHQFSYFPALGPFDECQVDKGGHWLLIKEDVDGINGEDNRIINLDTGVETVLLDANGAAGHSDNGFGVMVAADNWNALPNAIRLWTFGPGVLAPGPVVYRDPQWIPQSVQHLSFANARSAPLDQQYACGSAANRIAGPRANEVVCIRLDGSMTTLVVAPVMTDPAATGGGPDDYARYPKGNLDPTGQYFIWTSNLMSDRLDAFIVRVPSQLLVPSDPAADITAPTVSITAPAQAGTVFGDVSLAATAADNVGVAGVQFKLDGVDLGAEIAAPPFAWTWHTTSAADGTHSLTAVARDAAGNVTISAPVAVTILNTPAGPQIAALGVASVTGTSVIVGWTTNQLADSSIEYGLTNTYGGATPLDPALVSVHLRTIAGLTPGTAYHYRVTSTNGQGTATTSSDMTFATLPPPAITGFSVSAIAPTSATVSWTTDRAADSSVEYGASVAYGATLPSDGSFVTSHALGLSGLTPGATYHVRAHSMTSQGVESFSNDAVFTTPFFLVTNVASSSVTSSSAVISWTTSAAASTQVEYGFTTAYGSATTLDAALVTAHSQALVGLIHTSTYHYRVRSTNAQGRLVTSGDLTFTTPAGVLVSDVTVFNIQGASASINWSSDQAADTQIEYGLTPAYGSQTTLNTALVTSHGQAVSAGLVPGTTYHFRVRSRNAVGLLGTSVDATFTTAPAAVISAVAVASVTGTAATMTWATDLPASSKIEYGITSSYGSSTTLDPALVTSHSHTISGLTPGTPYFYLVRATTAQNALTKVGGFTFTTAAPPIISTVLATGVSDTAATIAWLTNSVTDSQVEYGPTTAYGAGTAVNPALVNNHNQALTGLTPSTPYHFRVKSRDSVGTLATSADATFTTLPTPVISAVSASALTGTSALITWTTNLPSNSRVEFGLTSAYGSVTTVDPGLVTAHSQAITGLTPGTTYFHRVRSVTAQSVIVELGGFTFTTVAAPVISSVAASSTTDTATVSWSTDQATDSQVVYGLTTAYGSATALVPALVTTHSQTLAGLTPGTLYHYRAQSRNSVGVLATSDDSTFTTTSGVVVSNVVISNVQGASAAVNWTTDQPADTQIEYGLTTSYGTTTTLNAALLTGHGQAISAGLVPGTTYHLRVRSRNAAGLLGVSSDQTVTTAPAPVISAVGVASVTGTAATISWTTDLAANSRIEYGLTSSYGSSTTLDPALVTSHTHTITGLSAGTTYYYLVRSTTAQNALAKAGGFTVTTSSAPAISNVGASGITATTATITWTTNQAADSQVEYGTTTAYGATTTTDLTLVASHSQGLSGLTAGTLYHLRVKSTNASAQSTVSADFTFTTAGPFALSAITASGITGSAVTISWATDQPSSSVVEYGTTTAYGSTSSDPAMVTSHSRTITGLANGTTYHYRVSSTDGIGQTSTSSDFSFTTVAAPVISVVTPSALTPTDATISWTTDQASSTRIEYGPTTTYGSFTTLDSSLVTSHAQSLSGLTIATLYHYRVRSQNAVGIMAISADFTFTTVGPPFMQGVFGNVSGTTATFQWTTSQPATTQIEYGPTTVLGSSTAVDPALASSHQQTITGLTPGANYFYRVSGTNSFGLTGYSYTSVFSMPALPFISGIATSNITEVAATISWATDQRTDGRTEYGLTAAYGSSTALDPALNYSHSQTLTGLTPATTYHYRVLSANDEGLLGASADRVFTTATPSAPVISAVSASALTGSSATISWTTDQASSTQIEYGTTSDYGSLTSPDAALVTSHSQSLSGLSIGTLHHYRVRSVSGLGAQAVSGDLTFTTVGPPVMQGIVGNVSGTTATFQWTTNQPATTQIEYGPTTALGTSTALDPALVTSHQQTLTGLSPGANYFYRMRGTNSFGLTGQSNISAFTVTALPVISNVAIFNIQGTAAAINWSTDQPADTQIEYGLTTAYGSLTTLNATLVTDHGQAVNTGLVPGTTYHFRLRSRNAAGLLGTSVDASFTTAPAPVISGVGAAAVTETSATIVWTTDLPANSKIEYGLTRSYGSATALDPALVTAHSQTITGLTPGTTYAYLVRSMTAQNALTKLGDFEFTTAAPPVVSNVALLSVTGTTARIEWRTNQGADSQVEYGPTTSYGSTAVDAVLVTAHDLTLSGLSPGTLYHYRVRSVNSTGQSTTSGDFTFTTTVPPVVSGVVVSGITGVSATINWTTDQAASSQIEYGLTSAYGTANPFDPAFVTARSETLANLTAGTVYHYRVRAFNSAGLLGTSADATFTTLPAPVISVVSVAAVTGTSATLTWTTDLPSTSRVEYGLLFKDVFCHTAPDPALVTAHSQTISGLTPGTTYFYMVCSATAQNVAGQSGVFTLTTATPPVLSNVAASGVTFSAVTINWTTNQAADSQVDYGPTTAYGSTVSDPALVTAHGLTLNGLTAATLYHYRVQSRNSVGLVTTSADGVVTTPQAVLVSNVAVFNIQGASAAINWSTDQPADSQIEYGPTTAYGSATTLNPALLTSHGQAVNAGLVPGTTYHFRIRARNGAGLLGTSADATFTTAPAAVISGVAAASVTGTTATITWTTDLPTSSKIEYGLTAAYGSSTTLDPALVTAHSHTITGLTQGTTYSYMVRATTAQNALTKLGGFTVTTGTPPVLSNVFASGTTTTESTIVWTTSQPADSLVEYGPTTAYGSTAFDGALVTAHHPALSGLTPETTYHVRVTSTNAAQLTATSADFTVTTSSTPVLPPYVSGVVASTITGGAAAISWVTAQPADSQIEYGPTIAYGSTTVLDPAPVTTHSQTLTGLAPGTIYHFRVRSQNGAGLQTSADGLVTPPAPVIANVTVFNIQGASASINWSTDQPADTQIDYGPTTFYGAVTTLNTALVTSHGQAVTAGLVPGTTYHFRIRARSAAGVLGTSADATFTTAPAAVISAVAVASVTSTSATIAWTTDLAANSKIEYGLTPSYGSSTTLDPALVTAHSHTITGLAPGTTYYFLIRSTTGANALSKLGGFTVTTAPAPVGPEALAALTWR